MAKTEATIETKADSGNGAGVIAIAGAGALTPLPPPSVTKRTVLIVDDDAALRKRLRAVLEEAGHSVTNVENGARAKTLIAETVFDLVIANAQLKDLGDLELLSFAKSETKSRFLLLAAEGFAFNLKKARDLGADEILRLSFGNDDFQRAFDQCLEGDGRRLKMTLQEDFIPVPIDEFITGSILSFDLFLRLNAKKFIKIGNSGTALNQESVGK